MFRSPRYLGVSFLKGQIQIAEVEHGRSVRLTALVEGPFSTDLVQAGTSLSGNHPQLNTFVKELQSLIKRHKLASQYISFALPPDPLFINIIPVDRSLKGPSLKEHLDWEMTQYYPDGNKRDFIVGSHVLPGANGNAQQAFVVGLRRGMVEFVQKAAVAMKIKMHIVDIDQFSTEKTVILNYPEILEHEIVLFGLRYGGIDASLIQEGQMIDYRAYRLEASANPLGPIQDYLRYLREREIPEPAALILHGIEIKNDFIKTVRQETGIKQTVAMNAVRRLTVTKNVYAPLLKEIYRFGAAIGLALRTE